MFDDEEEDNGFFLLVLGVLAAILLVVSVVALNDDELPTATVTGDTVAEAPATTAAAETTTTTAAPETTTTAAPATTTTEAAAPAFTLWDALNGSGEAAQFATIGGALGLRDSLEALEDEDGNPTQRTLFAPSDAAVAALDPAVIGTLTSNPDAAAALVGYHFLPGALSAEDLIALDGQTINTVTGLPMDITVVDGEVILNGTTKVTSADFEADNGTVHIIDLVLTPPTVNQILDLDNIEFEVSSANITAAGQAELDRAAEFFIENDGFSALIEGHTDTDGSAEGNQALSQSRAEAVKTYLEGKGIDGARLTAVGLGETQPILVDGVEDKPASRRIEFKVQ